MGVGCGELGQGEVVFDPSEGGGVQGEEKMRFCALQALLLYNKRGGGGIESWQRAHYSDCKTVHSPAVGKREGKLFI